MSKITLYTANPSRGTNVRWMLTECGADYDNVVLDYPQLKEADYLAINPMGKVPAIKHAGQVITELPAILTYLAELFPEKRLIPAAGTPERGNTTAGCRLVLSSNTLFSTAGVRCRRARNGAVPSATAISIPRCIPCKPCCPTAANTPWDNILAHSIYT